jgi:hypothetical protein
MRRGSVDTSSCRPTILRRVSTCSDAQTCPRLRLSCQRVHRLTPALRVGVETSLSPSQPRYALNIAQLGQEYVVTTEQACDRCHRNTVGWHRATSPVHILPSYAQ